MKFIILSEGLAFLKNKYGEIAKVLSYLDPSPSKKYTEFLCKHQNMIFNKFNRDDLKTVTKILRRFDVINKNLEKKDINQYKNWDELEDATRNYVTQKEKRNVLQNFHPDSKVIYEDEKIIVIRVDSKAASCQYGAGKFCIANPKDNYWEENTKTGGKFFYLFEKDNIHQPYVIWLGHYKDGKLGMHVWDYKNHPFGIAWSLRESLKFLKRYGLDKELFLKNLTPNYS